MDRYDSRSRHKDRSPRRDDEEPPYFRQEVPLRSDQALRIHKKLVESFLDGQKIFDYWRLSKVESLENETFEMEYSQIRNDFLAKGFRPEEVTSNLGFLATASDRMIKISLREGLGVKSAPINTLGYCIAGVHLSKHADVCLQEAALELGGYVKELILVAFKFMYGRRNMVVPSVGGGAPFWSPTPGYNSHVSSTTPSSSDPLALQHSRSLVYLYEFENELYHPRTRPRHCCPSAALYFKLVKPLPSGGLVPVSPSLMPLMQSLPTPETSRLPPALQSAVDLVTSDPAILKMVEGPSLKVPDLHASHTDHDQKRDAYQNRVHTLDLQPHKAVHAARRSAKGVKQPLLKGAGELPPASHANHRFQTDSFERQRAKQAEDASNQFPKSDIHSRLGPKRHPYLKSSQPWRATAPDETAAEGQPGHSAPYEKMTGGFRVPDYEDDYTAKYPPPSSTNDASVMTSSRRRQPESYKESDNYHRDFYDANQSSQRSQPAVFEPSRKRVLLGDGTIVGAKPVNRSDQDMSYAQRGAMAAPESSGAQARFKRPPLLEEPNNSSGAFVGPKRERGRGGGGGGGFYRGRGHQRKSLL